MSSSRSAAAPSAAFDFAQLEGSPHRRQPTVTDAAARARSIVAAAETEADRIRTEAAQRGYAEGFEAGRAEARVELEPALGALSEAVEQVRDSEAGAADAVEREAVGLAV